MPGPIINIKIPRVVGDPNDWLPDFPNPADLVFDYYRLLSLAQQNDNAIGYWPGNDAPRVAIVGAGSAGMTAARELFRSGYEVAIYEASDRICGRHYTMNVPGQSTGMELGAMRFPYFSEPGSQNCILDYYLNTEAGAVNSPFPNPGSAPGGTGIYMNQGYGPNDQFYPEQKMISWPYSPNDYNPPPNKDLAVVYDKVYKFVTLFTNGVKDVYATEQWSAMWQAIANNYDKMSFSDLVFTPAVLTYQGDGWFGGFGMNAEESQIFYTIGSGDGSWGAFYEIGAMWFIRCVIFGYNSDLQAMSGLANATHLPYYNDQSLYDSNGAPLPAPLYSGIQSLVEWLFYVPAPGAERSLFEAVNDANGASLYLSTSVSNITKTDNGVQVTDSNGGVQNFDYVILTPEIWRSELATNLQGFNIYNDLPSEVISARNEQHIIAAAKIFFPLRETYWEKSSIPQLIVTDTFVQDAYGVKWANDDPGVLLASYTWEDDAVKLLAFSAEEAASKVLAELDNITSSTLNDTISSYVDASGGVVWQWVLQPTYNGCAKLYRQRNWTLNYALLAYNQQYSASSRLYFAGESYGVEGGWTEPALRLALDAVIHLIQNSGGVFLNGFTYNDYPQYDTSFTPNYEYPVGNDT